MLPLPSSSIEPPTSLLAMMQITPAASPAPAPQLEPPWFAAPHPTRLLARANLGHCPHSLRSLRRIEGDARLRLAVVSCRLSHSPALACAARARLDIMSALQRVVAAQLDLRPFSQVLVLSTRAVLDLHAKGCAMLSRIAGADDTDVWTSLLRRESRLVSEALRLLGPLERGMTEPSALFPTRHLADRSRSALHELLTLDELPASEAHLDVLARLVQDLRQRHEAGPAL